MVSCKLGFKYKILGFYNIIEMKYNKPILEIVFKVSKQWALMLRG